MHDTPSNNTELSPDFATVLAELARTPDKAAKNLQRACALLNQRAATTLDVARSSIWLFTDSKRTKLRCIDLYEQIDLPTIHYGNEDNQLTIEVFPDYINALKHERVIRADDAALDPRTAEFAADYLPANDIKSMLDAPIRQNGEVVGAICLEQTGHHRKWTDEEANFVATLSDFATIALLSHHKDLAEAELNQTQKMESLGRLASGIAHDFNNILTVITGAIDTLQMKLESPEQAEHMMSLISDASQKARNITRNLLAFGSQQNLDFKNISSHDLMDAVQTLSKGLIRENISVHFVSGEPAFWVKADQAQLEQVILNLMINSMDAMPNGGSLEVTAHTADERGFVGFSVTDSGPGISEHLLDKIFDPFFSTKGEFGNGLGLSIAMGIVRQHGGNLSCVSNREANTCFKISLPSATKLQITNTDREKEARPLASPRPLQILLVEDDLSVRNIVAQMLRVSGYEALVSDTATHALAIIADNHIDLLVSDVVMPDMRGPDLYIEALKIKPDLKALFVSGYSEEVISEVFAEDQQVGYLSKPFTLKQFRGAITQVLADAKKLEQKT